MSCLELFPNPPPKGFVTISEKNGELIHSMEKEDQNRILQNLNYPVIDLAQESKKSITSLQKESAKSAFLDHKDTFLKRVQKGWYEHGLTGVLEELTNMKEYDLLSRVSGSVLAMIRFTHSVHGSLFPHLALCNEDLVAEFSRNSDWLSSPIKCFAWHPHTTKFAIVLNDDSIKVYTSQKTDIIPILKHKLQKGVADLNWKPYSASVLAVACYSVILVWNVDPTSLATRPSASAVIVLSQPGHTPVTNVSWCPRGSVLVSSCPTDSTLLVWDVSKEICEPIKRRGGGGISLLKWAPDGTKLLTACPGSLFRVWNTHKWTNEHWTHLAGRCQTACWSPDGKILLFSTTEEDVIYQLTFQQAASGAFNVDGSNVAIKCLDLNPVHLGIDQETKVGGLVQNMVWDPKGERLAVHFKDSDVALIALYQTRLSPVLELLPCGFIRGAMGTVPNLIKFQPNFDLGALLTVVWSKGEVSFIPLYFIPRGGLEGDGLQMQQNINGHVNNTQLYTINQAGLQ